MGDKVFNDLKVLNVFNDFFLYLHCKTIDKMRIISPSILAADFGNLGRDVAMLDASRAEWIHFDVMDGVFVPNISFGFPVLKSVRSATKKVLDVHLMITDPIRYTKRFAEAGADIVTFHYEATEDIAACIESVRSAGAKVGISIKPATDVRVLEKWLPELNLVLVMSVEPGFGGQKLIPECLDKVQVIRKMINDKGLSTDLEVDGGINLDNVAFAMEKGANVIVAGSAVFKDDIAANAKAFLNRLQ